MENKEEVLSRFDQKLKLAQQTLQSIRNKRPWKRCGTRTVVVLQHSTGRLVRLSY
ncbi:hypothetical protein [Saccharophagus degradans]|uniref:Uncharacterized protein n=1 Tax=Saccharophagus degradans TaxID=86304 RepID=A0AAW7X681_9GAMM|nr:hypothetical protein [Saccharophagus degradans]MDO6423055.1 hypothetical protein [Saccharophagus degradans]MDO6607421.1 hypothetical protein [Saccharophagus degradans]